METQVLKIQKDKKNWKKQSNNISIVINCFHLKTVIKRTQSKKGKKKVKTKKQKHTREKERFNPFSVTL